MERNPNRKHCRLIMTTMAMSLIALWSLDGPYVVTADDSLSVCVLNISSKSNKILSVLVNQPQNFNIAVPSPIAKVVKVPVPCNGVETLALGVANQNDTEEKVTVQVFTQDGILFCSKGPFTLAGHGSQGVTFTDCQ